MFREDLRSLLARNQFTRHLQSHVLFGRDDYLTKASVKKFSQGLREPVAGDLSFLDVSVVCVYVVLRSHPYCPPSL